MLRAFCAILALCGVAAMPLVAQSDASTGEVHGTVTDPTGAVITGAKVSLKNEETGLSRDAATEETGDYRLLRVPSGVYEIRVEKDGFRTHVAKSVRVTIGQVVIVTHKLELGVTTQLVEVTGDVALIETERTHQSDTLQREFVQNLPIDRRDYLTFTLLAPGVVDSKALADNSDFRVTQTPTSGLSFYGSNGRGNSITVDGGEANDDGGGVRPTMSQEAVEEFQINRSNYSAELGGASGGVINIVSKTGTNNVRGSAFAFFRSESFDAGDPFANVLENGRLRRIKPSADRQQFGGSLGGPLSKDRTFFFGSFEGLNRDESTVVPVLTNLSIFQPTPAQEAILRNLPAAAAGALRAALTAPPSTVALFEQNSGIFPFRTDDWKFSGRLDHAARVSDLFFLRYNYTKLNESNASVRALVGNSRGSDIDTLDSTVAVGWTHTFSPRMINELRAQWNYNNFLVSSIERFGPEININGFGFFNRDIFLPSNIIMRRYEIKDNVSYFRGNHNLKFGGLALLRGNKSESHTFMGGRFTFGELPAGLVNPALASTTLTAVQAFNLGLPQFYQQGFGDPTVASTNPYYAGFLHDSWKVRPNLTLDIGLRYELDDRRDPMPTDTNNFAPRFAFAWDPFSDHKTTVRGGYGIFYSPIYYQIDYVVNALGLIDGRRQIAQVLTTIQTPGPPAANNIYTTLRRQGVISVPAPTRQIAPGDLAQFGITVSQTGPVPPFTVLFENSPDYVNPYSQQASFGIERQIGPDLAVSATYTYVRTLKITRARDRNLLPAPVDPRLGIRVWSTPYFVNPLLFQLNVYESTARAFYSGAVFELRKRFNRSFSLAANYTYSRALDEVTDFNSDFQPNDQLDLRAERALSGFDQRHKFVAYGVWEAPARFQLSPIFRANSGRPFNLLAGADINGDRHSTTDRPVFAGRNTGLGPDFWTFDLRLSHRVPLGERRQLQLMAEAFNLFNRTNFASVNNTVGNIAPPFRLTGRRDRNPSEPLGFTSLFDMRRLQLGLRLTF